MLYFFNPIYKVKLMTKREQVVLKIMHERGEATRPQLAAASGLSLVTVGKAVESLCRQGALLPIGEVPSGGGRPVQLYRYHAGQGRHLLIKGEMRGSLLYCELQLMDLHGSILSADSATFAGLEEESLDGLIDGLLSGSQLNSLTLQLPAGLTSPGMRKHLRARYSCRVSQPSAAGLLVQEEANGTIVITLKEGEVPSAAIRRDGNIHECGPLQLLPLPGKWTELNYDDRTMVEEMTARLIVMLTCTLTPRSIVLHTPPLSLRLTERIRYNVSTKLGGALPELKFLPFSEAKLRRMLINHCAQFCY